MRAVFHLPTLTPGAPPEVRVLPVDQVPRIGESVVFPELLGSPPGAVRFLVDDVLHYPQGGACGPGRYVVVELV